MHSIHDLTFLESNIDEYVSVFNELIFEDEEKTPTFLFKKYNNDYHYYMHHSILKVIIENNLEGVIIKLYDNNIQPHLDFAVGGEIISYANIEILNLFYKYGFDPFFIKFDELSFSIFKKIMISDNSDLINEKIIYIYDRASLDNKIWMLKLAIFNTNIHIIKIIVENFDQLPIDFDNICFTVLCKNIRSINCKLTDKKIANVIECLVMYGFNIDKYKNELLLQIFASVNVPVAKYLVANGADLNIIIQ